ncbi:uncharacterized protein LOC109919357 [Rhincodon typus]|uniref:uncharacterized protein LOC109919357 n=1 Tax=Rhincodon typus TaxID=259920 RepID=UPI00202E60C4|nr:uncharacterized protein LOC109919357 [Rhincodon typus]
MSLVAYTRLSSILKRVSWTISQSSWCNKLKLSSWVFWRVPRDSFKICRFKKVGKKLKNSLVSKSVTSSGLQIRTSQLPLGQNK